MRSALEAMERIRVSTTTRKEMRLEETISTEISLLNAAIMDVEQRMRSMNTENSILQQELDSKLQILGEVTVENEELIGRLHVCETELQALRANSNHSNLMRQDDRIHQLESELSRALSEKDSILNSTLRNNSSFVKIDKTTDEQGQVIETLIDDNEKHLETIHQKDRIIEELQRELRRAHEDENTKDSSSEPSRESTSKYIEIIQRKNKTIEELRGQLEQANTESDKKLINDLINTLSTKTNDNNKNGENNKNRKGIEEELKKIKTMLSSSHKDLVEKIITLEEGLGNLRNENRSLRKQMAKEASHTSTHTPGSTGSGELNEKFHKIMEENATLRDSLNKPYPGLVQNILMQSEEVKRLHEENELLRLGLSENKRELVDSNLRKRQRIKDMQERLEELEAGTERDGSRSVTIRKDRGDSPDVAMHVRSARGDSPLKTPELLKELDKQNAMLRKLEDENYKMSDKSRRQLKQLNELKDENERLRESESIKQALEYEVQNLREALTSAAPELHGSSNQQQRMKELELELQAMRHKEEGAPIKINGTAEFPLDNKTKEDLHRMAKIASREKEKSEDLLRKAENLERDKSKLGKELERSEDNVMQLEDDLRRTRRELGHTRAQGKEAESEIITLRGMLENRASSSDDAEREAELKSLTDDLNILQQDRVILQNKMEQARQDNVLLDRENNALKTKLHESNVDSREALDEFEEGVAKSQQEITELNRELDQFKEENKELQEINEALVEEVQKMRSEAKETEFKEWLEQDVERRLALLSPDTHRSDLGLEENERQYKKDQQRLIRKLQIENQMVKAKLLSLEEENIAATKLISDMERGHGHLTGMLRSHLILQQSSTVKLLENSLQQYTIDYENLKKKFVSLEEKYNRQKSHADSNPSTKKRREDIWELFTNAGATITNINTILNEGLVKVEDDLEKEMTASDEDYHDDRDFEERDYKSRLWILRRRLSDVENRHRELQMRAEELNLRLDAKQTEFEVYFIIYFPYYLSLQFFRLQTVFRCKFLMKVFLLRILEMKFLIS